jgi:flagellar biosynthesis GTPase FlhF
MESYLITEELSEPQNPIDGSFEEFRAILDELTSLGVSIGEKYGGGKKDKKNKNKLRPFSAISDSELYKIRGGEESEEIEEKDEEKREEEEKEEIEKEEEEEEKREKKLLKSLLSEEDNVDEEPPMRDVNIDSFLEESREGAFDINDAIL